MKEKSKRSKRLVVKGDTQSRTSKEQEAKLQKTKSFYTLEFPQVVSETSSTDKLVIYSQHIQQQNLLQKLEAGSILGGESSYPFWNEYSKEISKYLSLPSPTDYVDLGFNWLNGYAKNTNANSWFSITANSVHNNNLLRICCPSSTASVLGFTDLGSTKNKSRKIKRSSRHQSTKQKPNSVLKIRVFPSKELHKVWKKWLAAYRYIYNEAINLFHCFDCLNLSAEAMDKFIQKLEVIPEWVLELPGHQRQEAIFEADDAVKRAKVDNGQASYKSCRKPRQTIQFKPGNFKNGTWYPRTTKGLTFTSPQQIPQQCPYGTELVYRGSWFACFPQVVEETTTGSDKVIALDPGNRTFLTGYDGESILEIGKADIGRINRLCSHLDNLLSRTAKTSGNQKRAMLRAANRMRTRIKNLVKDLHNKTASLLVNSYKLIYIPTFESSQMVIKSQRKINRKSVRNMLTWSHYKFRKHLEQAAVRAGVIVQLVNESYTSKTCSNCGHRHESLGGSKVFKCSNCGLQINRDWNGARNIMIRALQATAFTVDLNSNALIVQS